MSNPVRLTKADARRAMVRHHFSPAATMEEAFERLRSVQFDPLAPVGTNHDLVLQARVPDYRVGDWERLAYGERKVYDGWDKQASLVPYEGWPLRRYFHGVYRQKSGKVLREHPEAVEAVLQEIRERGPLVPKEFEFQERREEWGGRWHSANVTLHALRALWHTGQVMTADRRKGQHVYDLTERVVPPHLLEAPLLDEVDAEREIVLERHRAVGLLRPSAPYEVWSYAIFAPERNRAIAELLQRDQLVPVEIEGLKTHATPEFLRLLDQPSIEPRVTFIAPLDPIMWDRKTIAHAFGFDYVWEVYVPEAKRRWGYYVLPVLYGDEFAARAEFWCRDGTLEIRRWHAERELPAEFFTALESALAKLMGYCGATKIEGLPEVESRVREVAESAARSLARRGSVN